MVDRYFIIFNYVFVSLSLTSDLIFVGQLVDNDCQIELSKFCSLVHYQQSCKMFTKGLNLFIVSPFMSQSLCSFQPFISYNSTVNFKTWNMLSKCM